MIRELTDSDVAACFEIVGLNWGAVIAKAFLGEVRHAQHRRGEAEFWQSLGINPCLVAERLYRQRGDLVAMRAVIFVTIAERGGNEPTAP